MIDNPNASATKSTSLPKPVPVKVSQNADSCSKGLLSKASFHVNSMFIHLKIAGLGLRADVYLTGLANFSWKQCSCDIQGFH